MKLPSETEMQLLALLGADELSGREVALAYQEKTGDEISYGTLYTTFRRMKETGWVDVRDDQDADGRVRFFKLTGSGITALKLSRKHHAQMATFGLPGKAVI